MPKQPGKVSIWTAPKPNFSIDDQVFFAPREIFDKAGSKRSVPNEESIVSNYG
jgi:hypothetical protein